VLGRMGPLQSMNGQEKIRAALATLGSRSDCGPQTSGQRVWAFTFHRLSAPQSKSGDQPLRAAAE